MMYISLRWTSNLLKQLHFKLTKSLIKTTSSIVIIFSLMTHNVNVCMNTILNFLIENTYNHLSVGRPTIVNSRSIFQSLQTGILCINLKFQKLSDKYHIDQVLFTKPTFLIKHYHISLLVFTFNVLNHANSLNLKKK